MRHSQYNRMRVPRPFYCRESQLRCLCFDLGCATIGEKEAAESAERKTMGKKLRLLFIGNSHTYYNDMPLMAAKKARAAGYDCEVTMIAHGGWFLAQHVAEPDLIFCSAIMIMLFCRSMRIRLDRRRSFSRRRGN